MQSRDSGATNRDITVVVSDHETSPPEGVERTGVHRARTITRCIRKQVGDVGADAGAS